MAVVTKTLRATGNNSSLSRASNVVTVTLSTASTPNVKVGDTVVIAGVTPSSFNGTHTVTEVTSTTVYKFAQTDSDESSTVHGTSGGDYSLASTWESTEQTDLVTDQDTHVLECYNDWPSGHNSRINTFGWTTNATYFITVKAAAGHECKGVIDGGFYVKVDAGTNNACIHTSGYNVWEDIGIWHTGTGTDDGPGVQLTTGDVARRCVARTDTTSTSQLDPAFYCQDATVTLENCIALNSEYGFSQGFNDDCNLYNCTAVDCTTGFYAASSGDMLVQNCAAISNTTNFTGTFHTNSDYNAASDASSAPGSNSVDSVPTSAFRDYANDDFRPRVGGGLYDAGTDLSGTFTDDIEGNTRSSWDIGAHEWYSIDVVKTLRSSGGDYSLMTTWESTEQADLTDFGDTHTLECYDDWGSGLDDGEIDVNGWTTSSSYYITIKAAAGSENKGIPGNGFFLAASTFSTYVLKITEGYTRVEDIELKTTASGFISGSILILGGQNLTDQWARRCIASAPNATSGTCYAFESGYTGSTGGMNYFENCLAFDGNHASFTGFRAASATAVATFRNCVAIKGTAGNNGFISSATDVGTAINCVAYGSWNNAFSANWTSSSDYNASDDTSSPGSNSIDNITSAAFLNHANDDFRITMDSVLFNVGDDLSGTFTDDITGATRTQWSIGMHDPVVKTLRSSGGDYSLMSTWESTEQTDLVADNQLHYLECYADWPSGLSDNLSIAGWTVGASNYVTVKAAAGNEHKGTSGSGFYLKNSLTSLILGFYLDYSRAYDIEVENTHASDGYGIRCNSANSIYERVIAKSFDGAFAIADDGCDFHNCLATNTGSTQAPFNVFLAKSADFKNCTAIGGTTGYPNIGGTVTANNCVAYGGSNVGFTASVTGDYNASHDTSAPGANSVDNIVAADFVDTTTDDYRIHPDSALYNVGDDLSGTFTTDIRGATRVATDWDIGAYKIDVITKTLRSSLGDYTLMSTWESTEQTDLVAGGEQHVLECYADWVSGLNDTVSVTGWTTDVLGFITMKAAAGHEHNGVSEAGFWMYNTSGAMTMYEYYTVMQDLEFYDSNTSHSGFKSLGWEARHGICQRNIIRQNSPNSYAMVVSPGASGTFRNNLILSDDGSASNPAIRFYINVDNSQLNFENNTVIGTWNWSNSGAFDNQQVIRNNVIRGDVTGTAPTGFGSLTDSNAFGGTGGFGTNQITIDDNDFVDFANGDYQPAANGDLDGTGVDLSGSFTDDITNTTRVDWDIGAYIAEVITGYSLAADSGTLSITGSNATTIADRVLSLDPGTLLIVGSDASLTISYALSADAGVLNINGSDATLDLGYALSLDAGTLSLTGSDATLTLEAGFTLLSVDGDDTIYDGQTGVIILPDQGLFAASGNKVDILQSGSRVEQLVTAEGTTSITITVDLTGFTVPGAGTLRVHRPV